LYMSPEQARGLPTSPATDVYSAGVVLYEMLAGEPPFHEGSVVELGLHHLQDPPPPLPAAVPGALQAVVERALAKDPGERFTDAGEMERALARARGADGIGPAPARVSGNGSEKLAATRMLDRGALATRPLDRSARRTRVMKAPPPASPPTTGPRRSGGPRRRRALIALAVALAGAVALAVALLASAGSARTTVPELRRLPRGGVQARARRLHVRPVYSERHSETPAGIAIAQSPAPGTRVDSGAAVRVVLSSGPPPVSVPGVVGKDSATAEGLVADAGLRYSLAHVASPGSVPGTVVRQSPAPPASAPRGSTIALSLAATPQWRTLTRLSGVDDGKSVPFRILGDRWRVVYDMGFTGTCLLLVVCDGPSAEARDLNGGAGAGSFDLDEGEAKTHVFTSGPGLYQLLISGGRDSARWAMTVQDYY